MLSRLQLDKYADLVVWSLRESRRAPFKSGSVVVVRFDPPALELAERLYARLIDQRVNPVLRINPTSALEKEFLNSSSFGQLMFHAPGDVELMQQADGVVRLLAPGSLTHLADVDPELIELWRAGRREVLSAERKRRHMGELATTTCLFPTPALAESAAMAEEDYARAFVRALYLDKSQPEHDWRLVARRLREVCEWLNAMEPGFLHLESEERELKLLLGQRRKFLGFTGRLLPCAEVRVSPDMRGTSGFFFADLPMLSDGHSISGLSLAFDKGRVVDLQAAQGAPHARYLVSQDPGAARLGEFAMTDARLSRIDQPLAHPMLDSNFAGESGNCRITLGAARLDSFTGSPALLDGERLGELGFNTSKIRLELVNTRPKRVVATLASGAKKAIYENGRFLL